MKQNFSVYVCNKSYTCSHTVLCPKENYIPWETAVKLLIRWFVFETRIKSWVRKVTEDPSDLFWFDLLGTFLASWLKPLSFPTSNHLQHPQFSEKGRKTSHLISGRSHSPACLMTCSHFFFIILLYIFHGLGILFTLFSPSAIHTSFHYSLFLFFILILHYYIWRWDVN